MAESPHVNPSTRLASDLIAGLVAAGVREMVLCPGSRSAPLAYAAWAAEQAGAVRPDVRVDERSAGFLALGLAKVSRRPAAVITTSGTAVANLHPAVLEAHHALVPLIVVSADRPLELRDSGANQTTTQPGMYAAAVRAEVDLAADSEVDLAELACRVVRRARGGQAGAIAGPVHVNVQFREPLVPDLPLRPAIGLPAPNAVPEPPAAPSPVDPASSVMPGGNVLVVLGDLSDPARAAAVLARAARAGYPVVAEPFGAHAHPAALPHGALLLSDIDFVDAHEPDTLLVVGRPTLSRPVSLLLRRPGPRLVLAPDGLTFVVPGRDADHLDLTHWLASDDGPRPRARDRFARHWTMAAAAVRAAVDADPPAWGTGPALARAVVAAIPPNAVLFLGSSNTPRDVDLSVADLGTTLVVGNRGLAGIDGCVSTAVGIAAAGGERAAFALMGDLTFLHDSGGLLIGPDEPRPDLTIVVANDDGGGIFGTLEPGAPGHAAPFERLFGTPTGTDLGALCRAHGIPYARIDDPMTLTTALGQRPDGIRVIEVPLARDTHRAERARLRALAARVLHP